MYHCFNTAAKLLNKNTAIRMLDAMHGKMHDEQEGKRGESESILLTFIEIFGI